MIINGQENTQLIMNIEKVDLRLKKSVANHSSAYCQDPLSIEVLSIKNTFVNNLQQQVQLNIHNFVKPRSKMYVIFRLVKLFQFHRKKYLKSLAA